MLPEFQYKDVLMVSSDLQIFSQKLMPVTPSPLRYPGGKTGYSTLLKKVIDENNLKGCIYAEPFAGGAGAAITLLLENYVESIHLNDFDPAIYCFWKAILARTSEFIRRIEDTEISISEWKRQRDIYRKQNSQRYFPLGFATFYLNRCNRAGIIGANPIGGINQSGNYRLDARFNKEDLIRKIRAIALQKGKIKLSNLDAIDFIKEFNPEKKSSLLYFDPPYYEKGSLLYMNHYEHGDHALLAKEIKKCKSPWILSYDNSPVILDLYDDIETYRNTLRYSISAPSLGKELIFTSLRMPKELGKSKV